jgi:hypothetical protein
VQEEAEQELGLGRQEEGLQAEEEALGMSRSRRSLLCFALALVLVGMAAPSASASFHLIDVREVYPGNTTNPESDYVELQMYSAGQNQVNIGTLRVYNADASAFHEVTPALPVTNFENQRTVVMADSQFTTQFGITADDTNSNLNLDPTGGAVCWPVNAPGFRDCVSWGNFTGNATLIALEPGASAGTPESATGITNLKAIRRSITPNCSTLLQTSDDSNDTAGDFSEVDPAPRVNSSSILESDCVLTVSVTGSGTVTGTGINCPGDCTQTFFNGETVALTPTPTNGASFTGWSGACAGMGACGPQLDISRAVTANFTAGITPPVVPPTTVPTPTPPVATTPTTPKRKCKTKKRSASAAKKCKKK